MKKFSDYKIIDENEKFRYLYDKNENIIVKSYSNINKIYRFNPYVVWELDTDEFEKYKHHIKKITE